MATQVPGNPLSPVVQADESPAADHLGWQSNPFKIGVAGANLAKSVDSLDPNELARMTNVLSGQGGGVTTRPGLTAWLSFGAQITALGRLNVPHGPHTTLFSGVDGKFCRGEPGAPAVLDTGFTGPLILLPYQAVQSGEPWMYVADFAKMAKASLTSPALPIGLPKPAQPVVTPPATLVTNIAQFAASDGTNAAAWQGFAGPDSGGGGGSDPPTIYDSTGIDEGPAVNIEVTPGTATGGYLSSIMIARNLNLAVLPGGVGSGDQDFISFALRIQEPNKIEEVRLYFVCSPFTYAGVIPGATLGKLIPPGTNSSAYMRALRSSDYANFIGGLASGVDASVDVRSTDLLEGFQDPITTASLTPSSAALAGGDAWTQYGSIGIPLRKADFIKIGTAGQPGTDWSTITGIVIAVITKDVDGVTLGFDNAFLTGGYEPDTSEPDAQPFDYRVRNVDSRTGASSNPSDVLTHTVQALRQRVAVQPVPYGDGAIYQELFRRGGSLVDDWYFVADNLTTGMDGSVLWDNSSDAQALAAGPVDLDHDQPVTTADAAGNAVYGSPLNFLLGPIDGLLIGGGDIYRPGDLYWSIASEPDHWPAVNHRSICPPSEQLMNGGLYGGQGFVFSRERLYSLQVSDGQVTSTPTDCAEGLISRLGMVIGGPGIFFVARDAVRLTQGNASTIVSDNLRPLFNGRTMNGYFPIDFTASAHIRLTLWTDDLWFGYFDTNGVYQWWIFSLTYKTWRHAGFAAGRTPSYGYADPGSIGGATPPRLLLAGAKSGVGTAWIHAGFTDDGSAILCDWQTGALLTDVREEKLLGDVELWGTFYGAAVAVQPSLNGNVLVDSLMSVVAPVAYARLLYDPFGIQPQHAQSVSLAVSWTAPNNAAPQAQQLSISTAIQPAVTMKRATTWQPLNDKGEGYVNGAWIDCDTGGRTITVLVEGLRGGVHSTVATLHLNSSAGRRIWKSWTAVHLDMIRLRPTDDCGQWMLFGQGWLTRPEPPLLPGWDSYFDNLGDTYYTGLDIECNTLGVAKRVIVEVDGVILHDPATGHGYYTITANGRRYIHLTLPWGRGHIYRFYSTDTVPGIVYTHKWWVDAEPSEQHNFNQNFTIAGTTADKWLKGILLEVDTFGQPKSINVEIDGVPVVSGPFPVQTNGRKVVQIAFPQQLGRVFRIFPADNFPGRLYSAGWLFDQEPYQLTRFETQEVRVGIDDFKVEQYGQITYKAATPINMNTKVYGQDVTGVPQLIASDNYTLPATTGIKGMSMYKPLARKGLLYKYIFTAAEGFYLYREESWIQFQGWQGGVTNKVKPFGSDDLDLTRNMTDAEAAASRGGGSDYRLGTG